MLNLIKEQAADQIFGRMQWWAANEATFLVRFSPDESRCGIYISSKDKGITAEYLYAQLSLGDLDGVGLNPGIDCYAIDCKPADAQGLLSRLAAALD